MVVASRPRGCARSNITIAMEGFWQSERPFGLSNRLCRSPLPALGHMELVVVLIVGVLLGLAVGWLLGRAPQTTPGHGVAPAVLEARHAQIVAELRHSEGAARAQIEQDLAEARATVGGLREQLEVAETRMSR